MPPPERFHRPTAGRLLVECVARLSEWGPSGRQIRDIAGDAAISGEEVPERYQRWAILHTQAYGAHHQALRMRRDSMPRLRRELDQIAAEAYLLMLSEAPEFELHLGVEAGARAGRGGGEVEE